MKKEAATRLARERPTKGTPAYRPGRASAAPGRPFSNGARRPFIEHVQELRTRLLLPIVVLFVGAGVGYFIRDYTQALLLAPLSQPLYYTSPVGGFEFVFKLSLFAGAVAAIPVFTYNMLKFLEPIMPTRVRWLIIKVLVASSLLALAGMVFAYTISLPAALHFLGNFGAEGVHSWLSTNEYLSFVTIYLAGFALLFQLPLVLLFFNNITPLKPRKLMRQQRFVIVGSFIAAALITPTPDPFNQLIMAGPIIVLYQVSIVLIWLANLNRVVENKGPASLMLNPPAPTYTEGLLEAIPDKAPVAAPARSPAVSNLPPKTALVMAASAKPVKSRPKAAEVAPRSELVSTTGAPAIGRVAAPVAKRSLATPAAGTVAPSAYSQPTRPANNPFSSRGKVLDLRGFS